MKKILVLIAVLTAMLLTFGMAHAVVIESNSSRTDNILGNGNQNVVRLLGVADDAPGNDLVVPFICGKDAANNLDTLWVIAETMNRATRYHYIVYDARSRHVYDDWVSLTGRDIEPDSCKALITRMSTAQKAMIEKTIGGVTYYAGYIVYEPVDPVTNAPINNINNTIGWQYLVDLSKGFAAGFNSYSVQNNLNANLCESTAGGTPVCSTSAWMYPRYFLMNDNPDSFNWWVILAGTNDAPRVLDGLICDERERCISLFIPIPDELNIINVSDHVPAVLHSTYSKAGYGWFRVMSTTYPAPNRYINDVTIIGWSYQRAASTAGASLSWSVIHPIHKDY